MAVCLECLTPTRGRPAGFEDIAVLVQGCVPGLVVRGKVGEPRVGREVCGERTRSRGIDP